jgi:hypothetical protein
MHTMPFGRHRDRPLSEVPTHYLRWLVERQICQEPRLADAVEAEYRRRLDPRREPPPGSEPADLIRRWHRQMSLTHHPDRGGEESAMKAVNEGYDLLKSLFGV